MSANQNNYPRGNTPSTVSLQLYPERDIHSYQPELGRSGYWACSNVPMAIRKKALDCDWFVKSVNEKGQELEKLPKSKIIWRLLTLRKTLRYDLAAPKITSEAFALIRELSLRCLDRHHHDNQIHAGWVMLNGMVAEMDTGEGKTLAISLAAATAALAGAPTHVLTVNDYLAERDATTVVPLFRALGLRVGVVTGGMGPVARRAAYACDVTYCTAKELAFDYLRDRLVFDSETSDITRHLDRLYGSRSRSTNLLLRGLHFAILDECDSILIDEANSPIVLAGSTKSDGNDSVYLNAIRFARSLDVDIHFTKCEREKWIKLTEIGRNTIRNRFKQPQVSQSKTRENEGLITTALSALHFFQKDQHYLVRDSCIQIIDENTGRVRLNNSWERGLQQMIEAKESCKISPEQKVLSRISFQKLFRRYLKLAGTTGTASQVKRELRDVYSLEVIRIPTHRHVRRQYLKEKTFTTDRKKLDAIVARVEEIHNTGRPVLLATRTVESSDRLSRRLTLEGLKHQLLSAKQDKNEAMIIARAGALGCITIATNMAGRGTDITINSEVLLLGGLHVIATERHEAARIDHQLYGRCARQGDPGSCELFTSSQDKLVDMYGPYWLVRLANSRFSERLNYSDRINSLLSQYAQSRSERHHTQIRQNLLQSEESMQQSMGFAGPPE